MFIYIEVELMQEKGAVDLLAHSKRSPLFVHYFHHATTPKKDFDFPLPAKEILYHTCRLSSRLWKHWIMSRDVRLMSMNVDT